MAGDPALSVFRVIEAIAGNKDLKIRAMRTGDDRCLDVRVQFAP
jgi:hypothetical protein